MLLTTNDDIQKRVQELVRKAAEKAGVTIERIVADDAGRPGYVPTSRPIRRKRADQRLVRFP
jgi:hypothetical protein